MNTIDGCVELGKVADHGVKDEQNLAYFDVEVNVPSDSTLRSYEEEIATVATVE